MNITEEGEQMREVTKKITPSDAIIEEFHTVIIDEYHKNVIIPPITDRGEPLEFIVEDVTFIEMLQFYDENKNQYTVDFWHQYFKQYFVR